MTDKCSYCAGSGIVNDWQMCRACEGSGKPMYEIEDESVENWLEHPDLHVHVDAKMALEHLLEYLQIRKLSYPAGEKERQFAIILTQALLAYYFPTSDS